MQKRKYQRSTIYWAEGGENGNRNSYVYNVNGQEPPDLWAEDDLCKYFEHMEGQGWELVSLSTFDVNTKKAVGDDAIVWDKVRYYLSHAIFRTFAHE